MAVPARKGSTSCGDEDDDGIFLACVEPATTLPRVDSMHVVG